MLRVAIIDLGTNSIRFDIHEIGSNHLRRLYREKLMVRLGEGLFEKNKLSSSAMQRTIVALSDFKQQVKKYKVERIRAFGTAALRVAENSDLFLKKVSEQTGFDIQIISGEEEANLIATGFLTYDRPRKGGYALVDIGGGSTEISVCQSNTVLDGTSFSLGVAKLQETILKTNPPLPEHIKNLRSLIRATLNPKIRDLNSKEIPLKSIIGSSGTAQALSQIIYKDRKSKKPFQLAQLKKMIRLLSSLTVSELISLPGMDPKRIDLILAGAIILEETAIALKVKKIELTEFSLRDGVLAAEINNYAQHRTDNTFRFKLEDIEDYASTFSVDHHHRKCVAHFSDQLFEILKKQHGLGPEWKQILIAAAHLHDLGESIQSKNHAEHSRYIVQNMDMVGLDNQERAWISLLCGEHKNIRYTPTKATKDIAKLLAILQVADALDRGHQSALTIRSHKLSDKNLVLLVSSRRSLELEIMRLQQKKTLFQLVYGKDIEICRTQNT